MCTLNPQASRKRKWLFSTTQTNKRPQKKNSGNVKKKNELTAIPINPPVITVSCFCANDLLKDTTIVNIAQVTKPLRILIEQKSDPTLVNFRSVRSTNWEANSNIWCTLHALFLKPKAFYRQRLYTLSTILQWSWNNWSLASPFGRANT